MRTAIKNRAIPCALWLAGQRVARRGQPNAADDQALLAAAAAQGSVSEEEVRFIASLDDPVSRLLVAGGPAAVAPDRLELTLDRARLDRIRAAALARGESSPVEQSVKENPQVVRLLDLLNDRNLTLADYRSAIQGECRKSFWALGSIGTFRLWRTGLLTSRGGISETLGKRLATDPALLGTLNLLLTYIVTPGSDKRIEVVWQQAQRFASASGGGDATERALAAMALFCSEDHMEHYLQGVPNAKAEYQAILGAMAVMQQQPESEVFSHDVAPQNPNASGVGAARSDYTADHIRHFFPHAYLAYELSKRGWSQEKVRAASAVAGMVYELYGGGLAENSGNDSVHDILKNFYGAAWGTQLAQDPYGAMLPRTFEGPAVEDRDRPNAKEASKLRRLWDTLMGI